MKAKILSSISILISITAAVLFLQFNMPLAARILALVALLAGVGAYKNVAAFFSALPCMIACFTFAIFTFHPGEIPLLPAAFIILGVQNFLLSTMLPFSYTRFMASEPILGVISLTLYLYGGIAGHFNWQWWLITGITFLLMDVITLANYYDRVQLRKSASKGYIQNGQKVPEFTLPTHEGKEVSLKDYHGKYLLLIFVRGDWCPGCHIMLRSYERNREKFAEKNVQLLAIGPDPQGVNRQMMEKLGLHYELLSDAKQEVAIQYCVELQKPLPNTPHLEFIPLPASFLIDKEGILRFSSRADRAGEILQPHKIFEVLQTI